MSDSEKPKSIWDIIIENSSKLFNKGANFVTDIILQIIGFFFVYAMFTAVIIIASGLLYYLSNNYTETIKLSWYGIFWIFFWLSLFLYFNRILQRIRIEELKNSNSSAPFNFLKKFDDFKKRKVFTLISFTIASAYIFSNSFEETAAGDFDKIITQNNISIDDLLIPLLILLIGTLTDIFGSSLKSETKSENSVPFIFLLGAIEFFSSILIFVTGILGGKAPLSAAENIKSFFFPPWDGFWSGGLFNFSWYPSEYAETSIRQIYHNLSSEAFIILYIIVPLLLYFYSNGLLKRREKNGIKPRIPEGLLISTRRICIVIFIFVAYVGWHEKWFQKIFQYFAS